MKFCQQYQEMLVKAKVKTDLFKINRADMRYDICTSLRNSSDDVIMMVEWNISNSISQCEIGSGPLWAESHRTYLLESQETIERKVPTIDFVAPSILLEDEEFLKQFRSIWERNEPGSFQNAFQLLSLSNNTYQQIKSMIKTSIMSSK